MPRRDTDDSQYPGRRRSPGAQRREEQPRYTEQQKDAIAAGITKDGQAWEVTEDITYRGNLILKEGTVVGLLDTDDGNRACIATHYVQQRVGDSTTWMPRSVALTDSQRGSLRKTDRPFRDEKAAS